jgi:glycine/D-amino acid oxidase-like deaminating enzyme
VLSKKHKGLFEGYTHTRMFQHKDNGDSVTVTTEGNQTITAKRMIMATNVPIHNMSIILKEAYYRTYCIAISAPKGSYPDKLIYTNGDPYIYVRKAAHPDNTREFLVVGGEDHKVGQESPDGYERHYQNLTEWTRQHFPYVAAQPEFKWSGQIVEPNDYLAFTGVNTSSEKNVFVNSGDSGNGLTHGVIASRLLTDLLTGTENGWKSLYDPARKPKPRTATEAASENLNQNLTYRRWLNTDISDIEELAPCTGGVIRGGPTKLGKPLAVYKDGEGGITKFSAVCPHMKGIVSWNNTEKSWDCPGEFYSP